MKHASLPLPPLQPLLFWEIGVLLFAAGIVAARFPLPALAACALIAWTDSRLRRPLCCLVAIVCMAAGWWTGKKAEPVVPTARPPWLERALSSRRAISVEGHVVRVRGLPDKRLQIVLTEVRPAGADAEAVLPGALALTWETPDAPRPLPGQRLTAKLKIRPVHGLRNRDLWNSEDYWHRQGIFFQAWTKENEAAVRVSGLPAFGAALRERLRLAVQNALEGPFPFFFTDAPFAEKGGEAAFPRENSPGRYSRIPEPSASAEKRAIGSSSPTAEGEGRENEAARPSSVIPALLFGDRFGLTTPDLERVNAAGLMHSFALSGQHLSVAALGALALTALVGLAVPGLFLRFPAYSLIGLLSVPLAAAYLWLGGAPPSLIRATLMLSIACVLRYAADLVPERWRRNRNLRPPFAFADIVVLALACMLLNDPLCVYDLGVRLSFAAVAGISLCAPLFHRLRALGPLAYSPLEAARNASSPRIAGKRLLRLLSLAFGCSLAAQLTTLPFVLDAFGRSTLWFPLNLIWLPVLGFFVLPLAFLGLLACAVGCGEAASLLLHLAALPCDALLYGLRWLEANAGLDVSIAPRPHWSALLGFGAVCVGLCLRLHRNHFPASGKRLLLAGALLLCVGPLLRVHAFFEPVVSLRVLDVGQGQALLLEWPHGGRALIDGGGIPSRRFDPGRDVVSLVLTANALPKVDFIALSHPDRDHLKGLLFIASRYAFDAVYTARLAGLDAQLPTGDAPRPLERAFASVLALRGIPRHTLAAGDALTLTEGLTLEVVAPPPGRTVSGNDGLIFRLAFKGHGLALLPGDAEKPYLRELLRGGADLSADVLVLPHHGSAGSFLPEFYDAVRPKTAVASAGAYNAYRLPSRQVREELARRGIPLFVTGEDGEVDLRWKGGADAPSLSFSLARTSRATDSDT